MKLFLPILLFTFCLGSLIGLSKTQSFLSDEEKSGSNILSVATIFATGTPIPTVEPTPTVAPTPTPIPIANYLVINEIYYDPDTAHQVNGQGGENRGEWVEIYNPTASSVNVNGWIVEDNTDAETLPNINIPAGGFLILSGASGPELQAVWSIPASTLFASASGGKVGNGFNNAGDLVRLKDTPSHIVDQVSWGGDTSVLNPAPPDVATGHSLERDPDGVDTDTKDDFVDRTAPTPGS